MAFLNEYTGELHLKIVLAGGAGSGKTTNLQSLWKQTSTEVATRLFDLHGVQAVRGAFEFLPLSLGENRTRALRLHVYTLPSHEFYQSLNQALLLGVDGVVFLVDSRASALPENERQYVRLARWLVQSGKRLDDVPLVFQYNHRDGRDALPTRALRSSFSRAGSKEIEAVAVQDVGVLETLDSLIDAMLNVIEVPQAPHAQVPRVTQAPRDSLHLTP